jgi:hypothetical protein
MIHESVHCKWLLLKSADWLGNLQTTNRTRESTFAIVERVLLVGFYATRKLLDTFSVSDKVRANLKYFPVKKPADYFARCRAAPLR